MDFHLEKIFSYDQVLYILEKEIAHYDYLKLGFIVTNDSSLLEKYLLAVNEEELKAFCRLEYYEPEIRVNINKFTFCNKEVYEKYLMIKNDEIISSSMVYTKEKLYQCDETYQIIYNDRYIGWENNHEFLHFRIPSRYRKLEDHKDATFHLQKLGKKNISQINQFMNTDILTIGKDKPDSNWEFSKNLLRYYDEISCCRFYISIDLLHKIKSMKKPYEVILNISTKIDKNHYIEYYTDSIVSK